MTAPVRAPVAPGVVASLVVFRRVALAGSAAVALCVLLGWAAGSRVLEGDVVADMTMKFNTAAAILLLAAGTAALSYRGGRRLSVGCAVGAMIIGALTIAEYVFGVDLRIDQLVVHDGGTDHYPGRPALNTVVAILLFGAAVVLIPRLRPRFALLGQAAALGGLLVVFSAVVGLATGTRELYDRADVTFMAAPTMLAIALLGCGLLLQRFDFGVGRALTRANVEGSMLRRLLPFAVAVPISLAYARLALVRAGLTDSAASWLYAMTVVVLLVAVVAGSARRLGGAATEAAITADRLRAIVDSSPLGVVTTDLDLRVTSWNPAAESIFGWKAAEVLGRPYPLLHADVADEVAANFREAADAPSTVERTRRRKDGSELVVQVAAAPLRAPDGSQLGVLAVMADVTERHRAEAQLAALNAQLESRVLERTAELGAANDELQAFSYTVSHDLRAPLRALGGFSEALLEDYGSQLDERAHDYLSRIQSAATRMSDLIDDVLALSRVTRAELARTEVDLTALAREVVEEIASGDREREISVEIADGMTVDADPRLLHQLLQNLVENAWKFTGPTVHPRIEIGVHDAGGVDEFYVADNGVGFDEKYADKLFQPFQRLHSTAEFAGNGVGLATVGNIVKRHGGDVRAESRGAGARISFTLAPRVPERRALQLATTGGTDA